MCDWTIRRAATKDFDAVLRLWKAAGTPSGVTDTCEGLARLSAADREALLLAQADGIVVGSLIVAWDGWRGSFYRLAVHPDWRRQGIATALLREGECRLQERGAVRLTAIVEDHDSTASSFWEAAGYRCAAHQVRFIRHLEDVELAGAGEREETSEDESAQPS